MRSFKDNGTTKKTTKIAAAIIAAAAMTAGGLGLAFAQNSGAELASETTGASITETINGTDVDQHANVKDLGTGELELTVTDLRGEGLLGDINTNEDDNNAGEESAEPVTEEPSDDEGLAEDAPEPEWGVLDEYVYWEPVVETEPEAEPEYIIEEVPFIEATPVENPIVYWTADDVTDIDGVAAGAKYGNGVVFEDLIHRTDGANGNPIGTHAHNMSELYGTSTPHSMTTEEYKRAREIFDAYNEYRAMMGLKKTVWSDDCANYAYQSAIGCAARFDRNLPKAGMQHRLGIPSAYQHDVSDILAWTGWDASAAEVVNNWHTSDGHRVMMKCPETQVAGVAVYHDTVHRVWYQVLVYDFATFNQAVEQ